MKKSIKASWTSCILKTNFYFFLLLFLSTHAHAYTLVDSNNHDEQLRTHSHPGLHHTKIYFSRHEAIVQTVFGKDNTWKEGKQYSQSSFQSINNGYGSRDRVLFLSSICGIQFDRTGKNLIYQSHPSELQTELQISEKESKPALVITSKIIGKNIVMGRIYEMKLRGERFRNVFEKMCGGVTGPFTTQRGLFGPIPTSSYTKLVPSLSRYTSYQHSEVPPKPPLPTCPKTETKPDKQTTASIQMLNEALKKLKEKETQIESMKSELRNTKEKKAQVELLNKEQAKQIELLRKENSELKNEKNETKKTLAFHEVVIKILTNQRDDLKAHIAKSSQQYFDIRAALQKEQEVCRRMEKTKSDKIASLKAMNASMQKRYTSKIIKLKEELQQCRR